MQSMPRPLFGYRIRDRHPDLDPVAAPIVAAVLAAPAGRRYRAALRAGETIKTAKSRARCIVGHRAWYLAGIARFDLPPDPALAIVPELATA
jgi:hypothetical protein